MNVRFWTNLLCLLIAVLTASPSVAQNIGGINNDRYRAVHWGVNEGLGTDRWHTAMLKDINGFLWIGGTHGELSRFDGSSFQQYLPDKNKPGSIRNNNCISFVEDSLHNIWIGTGKGLSRYDIRADTFSNFMTSIDSGTFNEAVMPFWATQNEIFCLESGSQVTTYDVKTFRRKIIWKIVPGDKVRVDFPFSYAIYDAGSNSIWMLVMHEEGLVQFSINSGKKTIHKRVSNKRTPDPLGHTDAEAMCYDRQKNCIWINSHDGLFQFTLDDHQFHPVDAMNSLARLKDYGRWVGIDIDPHGRIWLATMPKGIIIYDPAFGSVTEPLSDTALQKEVAFGNLKIYCDRDGLVWTSSWALKEIYQLIPYSPSVRRYGENAANPDSLSSKRIGNILNAGDGNIWIGTDDGLNIYNSESGSFKVLREKDIPGIKGNNIVPMVIDTVSSKAWINAGPGDWVYEMDVRTKRCEPLVFKDMSDQTITTHNIINYISVPFNNGIIFFDRLHGIFEVKEDSIIARLVIPAEHDIIRMCLGEDRKLFLNSPSLPANLTYYNTNGKWIKTPHPLDSVFWSDMTYDKADQTYWVAVPNKLIHYDKNFREIRSYTDEGGMFALILTILPDGNGNIWFNNNRKIIARLNTKIGIITTLSESDGYQKQSYDFFNAQGKEINDELYFVGNFLAPGNISLDRVSPDKLALSPPSSVYLKSLQINQQAFPLSTGVNNLKELSLRYFENKISIGTGIINYYSRGKSHIRYKLEAEGKNAAWEYGPDHYTIRYEELPPGKYKLVVEAANAANEFIGVGKTLLIYISPPFWNTWWFRSAVLLLVAAMLYSFIRYRSRNLKERNLLLEKKVMQRTNELNDSLAELKTTQDQLIQSEKMASLGELTSGIAHEIKNPLNFVNNFSEINMELITEIEEEQLPHLEENQKAQMTQIIKTLKKNSEKINHHGKRVDGIVKGMLQHSRLGNTTKEAVDINSLCDESLKLAWHGFRSKEKTFDASFETRFDPDLPQVRVFAQDFGRVMINLINNAFYTVHEKKKRNQSESSADTLQAESL